MILNSFLLAEIKLQEDELLFICLSGRDEFEMTNKDSNEELNKIFEYMSVELRREL